MATIQALEGEQEAIAREAFPQEEYEDMVMFTTLKVVSGGSELSYIGNVNIILITTFYFKFS